VSGTTNVVSSIVNFVSGGQKPQVESHFMSESGNLDVFFLLGPKPYDVFKQYGVLTGTAPVPPVSNLNFERCLM
jgi:alpha 1,3-glucosidase